MPSHNIYPTPMPDGFDADRRLEIHWYRDQDVMIGSTRWAGGPDDDRAANYLPGTSTNEPKPAWAGSLVTLTRDQVNHLIKQLRVARDQAYGRDE